MQGCLSHDDGVRTVREDYGIWEKEDLPGAGVVQVQLGGADLVEVVQLLVGFGVGQEAVLQQAVQGAGRQVEQHLLGRRILQPIPPPSELQSKQFQA